MRGSHHLRVPQRVQIDFECAEPEDDVRSSGVHGNPANSRAQAPNFSKVWNGTHIFTWKTKHACARVYQTYSEDGGETDIPTEDEEPSDPPKDVGDSPANQDLLFPPIAPDKRGPSITTVLVCSGCAYFMFFIVAILLTLGEALWYWDWATSQFAHLRRFENAYGRSAECDSCGA